MSKEELDALYENGDETTWAGEQFTRTDWQIARGWVEQSVPKGNVVLDLGCFDGGFLEPLANDYRCLGVEIHHNARIRAESKGIEIIGRDFSDIAGQVDCITAFDVIEHVERPREFVERCFDAIRPQGCMIISTGNLDALSFRLMGSRYWYCTIAEHISFLSPAWFRVIEWNDGWIHKQATFSHSTAPIGRAVRDAAYNLLYRVAPLAFRNMRKFGFGSKSIGEYPELAYYPPAWGSARDHFMVLIRKE